MHFLSYLIPALLLARPVPAQTLITGSISPDGKVALYYEHTMSEAIPNEFYFRDVHSLSPVSAQLAPNLTGEVLGGPDPILAYVWNTQILLGRISDFFEFHRRGELFDPGFSYAVEWSPDSHWVAISGGAHKFTGQIIYHLEKRGFVEIDLSCLSRDVVNYLHRHSDFKIQNLGVSRRYPRGHQPPSYVWWIDNGNAALFSYPFLLYRAEFSQLLEKKGEFYFILDCRAKPRPRIAGACN